MPLKKGKVSYTDSAASDREVPAVPEPGQVVLQHPGPGSGNHRPRARRSPPAPIPLLAAFLSALLPGLGQLYAGCRRLGAVALASVVLLLVAVLVAARLGPVALLPVLLRRRPSSGCSRSTWCWPCSASASW